jgi:TonB family protein
MPGRGIRAAVFLVAMALLPARALAQSSAVTPPHATDMTPAPYPAGASGSATVILELEVDREGRVASSKAIAGDEPFTAAAATASSSWRFTPALRGAVPVPARIRVRVDFKPSPPPTPVSPSTPAPVPHPAPRPAPEVVEVIVRGVRPEQPVEVMSGSEVRQLPGSFGDAFRAIEAMPGVTPIVSGLPYFLVRGAPPGDTGFFVDGVHVPALFHLGVGAAVVHPGLIDRVDFYPGVYPARFGRFTGGILLGETVPFADHPRAEASIRLIDAGGLAETPIDGGRGSVMVSGRYGYPGPLLSAVVNAASPGANVGLQYWDYQVRARWRLTDRDEVSAFVFGSYDSLSAGGGSSGTSESGLDIQFHRADLRWDHRTSPSGKLRVALTLGTDRLGSDSFNVVSGSSSSQEQISDKMISLRSEWSDRLAKDLEARVGTEALYEPFQVSIPGLSPVGGLHGVPDAGGPGLTFVSPFATGFLQTDFDLSAYCELAWHPAPQVELFPGMRTEIFTSRYPQQGNDGATALARATLDPRVTARWHASQAITVVSAAGVAHEPSNIPLPSPGLDFAQLSRGVQTAYQYSEGVEVALPLGFSGTATGFLHDYTGMADYYDSCSNGGQASCAFRGHAYGLEVLVRRKLTERFTGWLSYTLSRTERQYISDPSQVAWGLSEFDRPHVLNVVLAADLGSGWRAGARAIAYSGLPYVTIAPAIGSGGFGDAVPDGRGPGFFRLDVRLQKTWPALGGRLTFVVEWLNALLQRESISTTCSFNGTEGATCTPVYLAVPITFPSIGLEGAWGE